MKTRSLLALVLVALVVGLWWRLWHNPDRVVRGRALDRREVALRVLGEFVAAQAPGQRALIIANPFSQLPGQAPAVYAFEQAAVRGLKDGWGDRIQLAGVAYPELSAAAKRDPSSVPLPPDATTPLSFLTTERAWDEIAEKHADANILVSVIGLPVGIQGLGCWRKPAPRFALLLPDLRLVGDADATLAAFRSGKILAAVLNRPGAPPETAPMARDFRAEFDARFILVTATNIEPVMNFLPNLF